MPSLESYPIDVGVCIHCHFPKCAVRYAGLHRFSEFASDSVEGADHFIEDFVGAFSDVVVRPIRIDAREHSHFGCAAYAQEKVMPLVASASIFGV